MNAGTAFWLARFGADRLRREAMKKMLVVAGAALLSFGATAPASAQSAGHILRGTGIGAAGGVLAGAIIPGLSVGEGALIGAAAGTLHNTLIDKGSHRTYRAKRHYSTRSRPAARSAPRYRSYHRAD
jgi:hypothetical protein